MFHCWTLAGAPDTATGDSKPVDRHTYVYIYCIYYIIHRWWKTTIRYGPMNRWRNSTEHFLVFTPSLNLPPRVVFLLRFASEIFEWKDMLGDIAEEHSCDFLEIPTLLSQRYDWDDEQYGSKNNWNILTSCVILNWKHVSVVNVHLYPLYLFELALSKIFYEVLSVTISIKNNLIKHICT